MKSEFPVTLRVASGDDEGGNLRKDEARLATLSGIGSPDLLKAKPPEWQGSSLTAEPFLTLDMIRVFFYFSEKGWAMLGQTSPESA